MPSERDFFEMNAANLPIPHFAIRILQFPLFRIPKSAFPDEITPR